MKIINLTPHKINILVGTATITINPSGLVARLDTLDFNVPPVAGLPVVARRYGTPYVIDSAGTKSAFPEPTIGTIYLVSAVVAQAIGRADVLAPDTSPDAVVRDEAGNIVAVRRLVCFTP